MPPVLEVSGRLYNGAAIVPGKADQSRLYRRIADLEQPSMPMDGALTAQQVATIKAWIDQGAHWDLAAASLPQPAAGDAAAVDPQRAKALAVLENMAIPAAAREYWAFKLPRQSPLPSVARRLQNPLDRVLEQARQEQGLEPAPRPGRGCQDLRANISTIWRTR